MSPSAVPDTTGWAMLGCEDRNYYRVTDGAADLRRPQREPRTLAVPAQPERLLLDTGRSALVVVDMQNDFCHPQGWVASIGANTAAALAIVPAINSVAAALRRQGVPIVWVNWGVRPDRANLSPGTQHPFNRNGRGPGLAGQARGERSYHVLERDSWGAAVVSELEQAAGDIRVDKHRVSGFWDTPLDSILRNLDVTTLLFAGVNADHCVLATLMDANFHGYDTILLEDCTATTSPDFCLQATFHNVRFCFGFTLGSAQLLASLDGAPALAPAGAS